MTGMFNGEFPSMAGKTHSHRTAQSYVSAVFRAGQYAT